MRAKYLVYGIRQSADGAGENNDQSVGQRRCTQRTWDAVPMYSSTPDLRRLAAGSPASMQ